MSKISSVCKTFVFLLICAFAWGEEMESTVREPVRPIQILPPNKEPEKEQEVVDLPDPIGQKMEELTIRKELGFSNNTTLYTLSNGLTVFLVNRPGAQTGTIQVIARKAGSMNELEKSGTGISRLLEYILVNGNTKRHSSNEMRENINRLGGAFFSSTTREMSTYRLDCLSEKIPEALSLMIERLREPLIESSDFAIVKLAVRQGYLGRESDREAVGTDLLMQTCYQEHPCRYSVWGELPRFDTLTLEDVLQFYRTRYVPNHLILGIEGNLDSKRCLDQIRVLFRSWAPGPELLIPWQREPNQLSSRQVSQSMPGNAFDLYWAWPTVTFTGKDRFALDLLALVLAGGRQSRLTTRFQGAAALALSTETSVSYHQFVTGLFKIHLRTLPGDLENVRLGLREELTRLKKEPVSSEELQRARRRYEIESLLIDSGGRSRLDEAMRYYLLTGDPDFGETALEKVRQLAPEDLRRTAERYFCDDRLNEVLLPPPGMAPVSVNRDVRRSSPEKPVEISAYQFQSNGFRILLKEDPSVPYVRLDFYLLCGTLFDTDENAGRAALLEELISSSIGKDQRSELADRFSVSSGRNTLHLGATLLKDDLLNGLRFLSDHIGRSQWSQTEFEKAKRRLLGRIAARNDTLSGFVLTLFAEQLPPTTPFHVLQEGSERSIAALDQEDMKRFHKEVFIPENMLVALFGSLDAAVATTKLGDSFGSLPISSDLQKKPFERPNVLVESIKKHRVTKHKNAAIFIAWPTVGVLDREDFAALVLLQTILGGYRQAGGQLAHELLDEGLAYQIRVEQIFAPVPSFFYIYVETVPENAKLIPPLLEKMINRTKTGGISYQELQRAKEEIRAVETLGLCDLKEASERASLDDLYGLGYNDVNSFLGRIEKVGLEDLFRVARKYFRESVQISVSP